MNGSYIEEELSAGRMVGPLCSHMHGEVHCSQVELVAMGQGSGQWHMIVDLSCPEDAVLAHLALWLVLQI